MKFLLLTFLRLNLFASSDKIKIIDNYVVSKKLNNNDSVSNTDYVFNPLNITTICKNGFEFMITQIDNSINVIQVKETVESNGGVPYDRFKKCND